MTTESVWALGVDIGVLDEVVTAALHTDTLDNVGMADIPMDIFADTMCG